MMDHMVYTLGLTWFLKRRFGSFWGLERPRYMLSSHVDPVGMASVNQDPRT